MSSEDVGAQSTLSAVDHLTPNVLTISPSTVLTLSPTSAVEATFKEDVQDDEEVGVTIPPGMLQGSQAMLVSPSLSNHTLQSLLATPSALQSAAQFGLPEGIQIITVSSPSSLFPTQSDATGRIWHVINPDDTVIAVGNEEYKTIALPAGEEDQDHITTTTNVNVADLIESNSDLVSVLMPPPAPQNLPPGCPAWAGRMKNCEKIGDYYRGYVDTEVELDILLTYHKQATQSFWGTRQSPSPAKQSTRFMWKSQYVPFDGIPFVNTGSRAVVMECQFGPRRKGGLAKKLCEIETNIEYRQTCPARIYIKKVQKFPEYKIDTSLDKRAAKIAMDKAFHLLKQQNIEKLGQDRFYVQLPTGAAHEFHQEIGTIAGMGVVTLPRVNTQECQTPGDISLETENAINVNSNNSKKQHRLHPLVVSKIRDIVAGGEMRVYNVRRLLRMYVCRELCSQADMNMSRHDLSLFPTVTDLKNHIHQAVKDIENGTLALTAPTLEVEPLSSVVSGNTVQITDLNVLPAGPLVLNGSGPVAETVTVTLTQGPGEDGEHVISRIETHMSDGTTHVSSTLTPETAQLLARLNPSMFPPGSFIQLKATKEDADDDGDPPGNDVTLNPGNDVTLNPGNDVALNPGNDVTLNPGIDVTLNSSSAMESANTLAEMNMEVQESDSTITILPKDESDHLLATPIITSVNPSLSDNNPLINVSIVPNVAGIVPTVIVPSVSEQDDLCDMETDEL